MNNTQILQFPIKGVNRIFSRSTQPQNTAYDMLNMLPFDRTGRLRGGKRSGTEKLWTAAIGTAADAVLLVDQVTYAVDPASAPPDANFTEPFTYANGALSTQSGGIWSVYDDVLTGASTKMTVASNKCVTPKQSAGNNTAAIAYRTTAPDYDQSAGYEITADVTLQQRDGISILSQSVFALYLEEDITTRYTTGYAFSIVVGASGGGVFTIELQPRGSTADPALDYFTGSVSVTTNVPFSLRVSVNSSRVVRVYIDTVQVGYAMALPAADGTKNFGMYHAVGDGTNDSVTTDNLVFTATGVGGSVAPTRQTKIVTVANRDVFMGSRTVQGTLATNGSNVIARGKLPQGCYSGGKYYIVDGTSIVQVDMATSTVETYTATEGTAPVGGTVCCMWRDRLVIAGPDQNVYFSRVGVHTDWDYSAADPGGAFSANASTAGHIGEPVVSLMPLSDDSLGIGGDHNLYVVRGDPKVGGSFDLVSDAIGLLGPRAWCKDPEGVVYFLGTGGLFKWSAGSQPVNISDDKWSQVFAEIDRSVTIVTMVWHRDRAGMYVFLYKAGHTITVAPMHLWYDRRLDGLFPLELPIGHGPTSAIVYDGDAATDRVLLLGSRDGYLRQFSDDALSDDGDAIESYVVFGPLQLGDANNDGVMGNATFTLGEPPTGLTASALSVQAILRAGLTAYDVTEGRESGVKLHTLARTYAGEAGRVTRLVGKVRGAWGSIELKDSSVDKTWGFESVAFNIEPAGLTRR